MPKHYVQTSQTRLVSARLPHELLDEKRTKGRGKTELIVEALELLYEIEEAEAEEAAAS